MFDFETLVGKNQAVMKADKRFRLEQESGKLLQVLSVKGSATVDDVEMTAQGLSVEGVWMADVLYLSTEDMTPVMSSSYMEPFTFFVETKNLTGNEDYQLDVRVDKTFYLKKCMLGFYLDIQNITASKLRQPDALMSTGQIENPSAPLSEQRYVMKSIRQESGTLLPTLGITFEY